MYGLRSVWCSISPFLGDGSYEDTMVQLAGSVIGSFGIYEWDQSLANPAQYHPVRTTGGGYFAQYIAQRSQNWFYNWTKQVALSTGPLIRYLSQFPSILFENVKAPFHASSTFFAYPYSVTGVGYLEQLPGFVAIDEASHTEKECSLDFQGFTGGNGGSPPILPYMAFFLEEGSSQNTLAASGGKYKPLLIEKSETSQAICLMGFGVTGCFNASVNPTTGKAICNWNNSSLNGHNPYKFETGFNQGFAVTDNVYFSPDAFAGVYNGHIFLERGILSDPTDNAALVGSGGLNTYTCVMTPAGFFLMYVPSLPYYLLLKGDFTGYYRIEFMPNSSGAASAVANGGFNVGFGMDLNGNIWWGGSNDFVPTLYSTFGFKMKLILNEFPTITGYSVGCRVVGGSAGAVWEG
jgi:hypothetical protein